MELRLDDSGKGAAFVPLLESYFNERIHVDCLAVVDLLDFYRTKYESPEKEKSEDTISMGASNWDGEDYIFMWEVSDLFYMIDKEMIDALRKRGTIIICNLATHVQEVQKLGIKSFLINPTGSRLPELTLRKGEEVLSKDKKRKNYIINPHSGYKLNDLINSKKFIKYYKKSYNWGDKNYANEYCEVYHLANLLGADVLTAITRSELNVLKSLLDGKDK